MITINAIALILYLASCLWLFKKFREHLVFFAFITFSQAWSLISCFYNDLGIYNLELFRYTSTTLATTRLALFYVTFNIGFAAMGMLINKRRMTRVDYLPFREAVNLGVLKFIMYAGIALVIIYEAWLFWRHGIPILNGLDRRLFAEQAGVLEVLLIVHSYLFAFLLGYYRKKRGRFSVNGLILAAYIVFAILIGNKFSFLLLLFIPYYAPIYIRYINGNPNAHIFKWKYVAAALAAFVLLAGFAFGSYAYVSKNPAFAFNFLMNRVFAFQGEMWWAADYGYHHENLYDPDHWQTEINYLFNPAEVDDDNVGMKYLMIEILGADKAHPVIEKGYLYTMTYPAILIAMFPLPLALIVQFIAGMLLFLMLYYLYFKIVYRQTFRAIVTVSILVPYLVVLMTGNFAVFFTLGLIAKTSILFFMELGSFRSLRREG